MKNYLIKKGQYKPLSETASLKKNYVEVVIGSNRYAVSNLITIHDFKQFELNNSEYFRYRERIDVDKLQSVNSDENEDLPASVTWYDAMAYVAWISKRDKLPVRLLTYKEFISLASTFITEPKPNINHSSKNKPLLKEIDTEIKLKAPDTIQRLCYFFDSDGKNIEGHPPYMKEEEFQNLIFKFDENNIPWKESQGLSFINSFYFGEWLKGEGEAINSKSGMAIDKALATPERYPFSPRSTGKYKSKKIGFRIIYRLS